MLQLRRMPEDTTLAQRIAASYLPLLGKKRWHALAEKLGVSEQEVHQAAALISGLSPHPGRTEATETFSPEYITPDVFIVERGDALEVVLNDFYVPQLRINSCYAALLTETEDPETKDFLRQKLQQAQWMMAHMERRRKTLERCAQLILTTHLPFFQGTTPCLAPLMQKDAAELMGVHASTLGALYSREVSAMPSGHLSAAILFPPAGRRRGALLGAGCPGQAGAAYQGRGSAPSPQRPAAQCAAACRGHSGGPADGGKVPGADGDPPGLWTQKMRKK